MKQLIRTILALRRGRSILFAVLPALAAGGFLAASVLPAQAASARVTEASQQNAPGARAGVQPSLGTGSIVNFVTNFCLGTYEGHNNTDAVVWPCNTARNQSWSEKAPAHYAQQIKNGNGDCLGVAGGSTSKGAHVVAWKCEPGARNQQWIYGDASCFHAGDPRPFDVIENSETGMFIGVSGASTAKGADLIMWPSGQSCPGPGDNQHWFWPVT